MDGSKLKISLARLNQYIDKAGEDVHRATKELDAMKETLPSGSILHKLVSFVLSNRGSTSA
jgi:hypothetical protein